MTDEVPRELIELHRSTKPREIATGYLQHFRNDLLQALNYSAIRGPSTTLTEESFIAAVNLEVATNNRVAEAMQANPASFMKSVLLAAQCKLLPGGAYDLFYLIPRKVRGRPEVTPLIGYKGLADMVQRHPRVHSIDCVLVFEGDDWEFDAGAGKMRHIVNLSADRDEDHMVGGYARAIITEPQTTHPVIDAPIFHVMNRDQLIKIKHRSDAWQYAERGRKDSAWHSDPLPMHSKTLLRALVNGGKVPKDMGIGGAITHDDNVDLPQRGIGGSSPGKPASRLDSIKMDLAVASRMEPLAFDLAEEAAAAMDQAKSEDELHDIRDQCQHFQGADTEIIISAYESNLSRLKGD